MSVMNQQIRLLQEPTDSVERSIRVPVLIFFGAAAFWLALGSLFWLLNVSQMYTPGAWWALPGIGWLSFGRSYPVFLNCMVYGWASGAGIGVGLWLLAKLCATPLRKPSMPIVAAVLWNAGVGFGVLSILAGNGNGKEMLEFPGPVAFILFLALLIVGFWAVSMFVHRQSGATYVSQWYLIGAFLWFPWMYATASALLNPFQIPGVAQSAIHWWFCGALMQLWLTPIALAGSYYFLPKIVRKPIYSYRLALVGFWGTALFGGWTGLIRGMASPLPAWMITASVVANVLMLIPVIANALNFHLTVRDSFEDLRWHLPLRFLLFGGFAYMVWNSLGALLSFRTFSHLAQFTVVSAGHLYLGLIAFISMILFGALYLIIPRLLGRDWQYPWLAKTHLWFNVVGLGMIGFALVIGGAIQGFALQDAKISMEAINDLIQPFLLVQNVAVLLIFVANISFAAAVKLILLLPTRVRPQEPAAESSKESLPEVSVA